MWLFYFFLDVRVAAAITHLKLTVFLAEVVASPRELFHGLPNCLSNCESRMYADNTHLPYAGNIVDYIATNIQVAFAVVAPMDLRRQGQHW